MNIPNELKYYHSHEWVKKDGDTYLIGITDFAQSELGDLVYINLPNVGDSITREEAFADVESVKAVSDIISPLDGIITEVNEDLLDNPERINQDAYAAWIIRVKDVVGLDELLSADQYKKQLEEEA